MQRKGLYMHQLSFSSSARRIGTGSVLIAYKGIKTEHINY